MINRFRRGRRFSDQSFLGFSDLERGNWGVHLCLLCPEEMRAELCASAR